jgi:hypothetical protein
VTGDLYKLLADWTVHCGSLQKIPSGEKKGQVDFASKSLEIPYVVRFVKLKGKKVFTYTYRTSELTRSTPKLQEGRMRTMGQINPISSILVRVDFHHHSSN